MSEKIGEYTKEDGKILLKLARESIEEEFTSAKPKMPEEKQFKQSRGVFVTLEKNGKLKGCIGFPFPIHPLYKGVYEAAKEAAFSDPRFAKLKQEELKDISIEISILTLPEEIKDIKEIQIGKDGLICNYFGYSGLLLPQVATEWKMNKIQFLEALCDKAGLPKDTWQNKNFHISRFQCQIFKEKQDL
jgi:AmmeMemoRadiSam system protein A